MEKELDLVHPGHLKAVLDQNPPRPLLEAQSPSMHDRIGQVRVTVVPTLEDVALIRGPPHRTTGLRLTEPHEISAGLRLVQAVDAHGVVGGRAAKIATPPALRVISVRP